LGELFQVNRSRPFAWGTWDCGIFAADAIQAMTGVDLGAGYRGQYSSAAEAALFGTVEEIVAKTELTPCPPNFAHRGDLLLVTNPRTACLGILGLDGRAVIVTDNGLAWLPRTAILRSWHIPFRDHPRPSETV
jgi:hypothetical protein